MVLGERSLAMAIGVGGEREDGTENTTLDRFSREGFYLDSRQL